MFLLWKKYLAASHRSVAPISNPAQEDEGAAVGMENSGHTPSLNHEFSELTQVPFFMSISSIQVVSCYIWSYINSLSYLPVSRLKFELGGGPPGSHPASAIIPGDAEGATNKATTRPSWEYLLI